jgi:hypothetical protein
MPFALFEAYVAGEVSQLRQADEREERRRGRSRLLFWR